MRLGKGLLHFAPPYLAKGEFKNRLKSELLFLRPPSFLNSLSPPAILRASMPRILVVIAPSHVQNVDQPKLGKTDSEKQTWALYSVIYVATVDIVLVWKRAGGNGKNPYKKLQSSH